jgi:hypothetical protein
MSQQGSISQNDLMSRLVRAKKVMDKVEIGDFEKGNVNEDILRSDPEEVAKIVTPPTNYSKQMVDVDRINQSKLPDAIKKAMIENPIPQVSLNDTLDMSFIKGAKKLMEREGLSSKSEKPKQSHNTSNLDINLITTIVENVVRKVLDEKLNQILTAQETKSINETLVLKVGDSIFKGKITGVNKSKKS